MKRERFISVTQKAYQEFVKSVPNPKTRYLSYYINAYGNLQKGSTGNLALNASKLRRPDANTAIIYVDDENIAPYMPYTNEPWQSPFWKGKKNPNEKWFDKEVEKIATIVSKQLQGKIKK